MTSRFFFALMLLSMSAFAVEVPDVGFYDNYDPDLPFEAEVGEPEIINESGELFGVQRDQDFEKTLFSFQARPGERVPSIMLRPVGVEGPLPVIIFVHGSGQKKEFIEEIGTPFVKAGFAFVSFDQHTRQARKLKSENIWSVPMGWRERGWKTVNDTRRLIDYLETRDDVHADRIYLVGASYGAITGTTVVARDKRVKAAALVVGGADFQLMAEAPLIRGSAEEYHVGWLLDILKPIAFWITDAADPVHYAPATAGTPVLMQCGEDDTLVSPESGQRLFDVLGEPKEIRWYDVDHPGLRKGDGPEVVRMLDEGLEWMLEHDAPHRS